MRLTRTYDELNRLQCYEDGEGHTINYTYHPSGELKTITYPGKGDVTYTYDDFGRLWKVTDWANRTTTYTYDNASRLTRIDRPNGTHREQEYDAASQLRFAKEYTSAGTIITFLELTYDADGRITTNFIHPKPAAVVLPTDSLLYDADNQLSTWNNQGVTFDADGNMTHGPLPSGLLGPYGYDSRNRLTSVDGSSYRYSPDGLRVEITGVGAATFVIDPNAALSRTLMRTQNGTTTYYVYGLGLLYEETNGTTKTYHCDQVGSTLALTDDSQTVTDRWSYSPYGLHERQLGSTGTPFLYNGELGVQTDANGLLHMRARYYNPRLMRFLNADPIGFGGGMNWYAAMDNNPISVTDPFGLDGTWGLTGMMGGYAPTYPNNYSYSFAPPATVARFDNGITGIRNTAGAVGQITAGVAATQSKNGLVQTGGVILVVDGVISAGLGVAQVAGAITGNDTVPQSTGDIVATITNSKANGSAYDLLVSLISGYPDLKTAMNAKEMATLLEKAKNGDVKAMKELKEIAETMKELKDKAKQLKDDLNAQNGCRK